MHEPGWYRVIRSLRSWIFWGRFYFIQEEIEMKQLTGSQVRQMFLD